MNLKSSLLALLGVSTIGGSVTGGYYLLRPNTTTNKQAPNKKENTSTVNSENLASKGSLIEQPPTPPASPSPKNQQDSPGPQLPSGGTSSVQATPSNISPSQEGAGVGAG